LRIRDLAFTRLNECVKIACNVISQPLTKNIEAHMLLRA
jgi:hypothetical protein